ncbi:hypothetical protein IU500_19060 [Nocardia terpenica]|uniref:hypothetical protein n=1 Tax=Nocardia terpenica TaxID=455432 RepID=UPI001895BC79|nr:hypothetical protein [Nocardia terpenica]MBF6062060.1 hypothetical protein [Nocardia terpenica]MBF6106140.1 hypothetical protein [Nocardia terpenica]MBF6110480.1 hypothetical protein [Nocardia terpenica]MBF6120683.1 hypothetical protein [Nocardia terpenica]MBF6151816.1 hypothetical protein [Nocardia terpenica]
MSSSFSNSPSHTVAEELLMLADNHLLLAALAAAIAPACGAALVLYLRRHSAGAGTEPRLGAERLGTLAAAAIATGVSAQGMWRFMGDVLHLTGYGKPAFFAFLEIMAVTSALRARAARRHGASGRTVDGVAMWVITCLSAVLSATAADNLGTLLFRLTAPLVAAWGWERSMAVERRDGTNQRSRITWTVTPERILVRLGLADPDPNRTVTDHNTHRKLATLAVAVADARALRDSGSAGARSMRRAHRRLRSALRRATALGTLVPTDNRELRQVLLDHIAVLRSADQLLDLNLPSPWCAAAPDVSERQSSASILSSDMWKQKTEIPKRTARQDNCAPAPGTCTVANSSATLRTTAQHRDHPLPADSPTANSADGSFAGLAERVCAADPSRRRDPAAVQEILRLWYDERRTYPQIANQVRGYSTHAVGRVIRQAKQLSCDAVNMLAGNEGA